MPAPRKLPDNDVLVALRNQGWTYDEIAAEFDVTQAAVYLRLRQAHAVDSKVSHKNRIPWTLRAEHRMARPAELLRLLGREEAGESIPPRKATMLRKWLREMKEADVVVCYDPDQGPNPASPVTGGFYYSRRRPTDGDSLIRE